jgi:hypothetical protein
MQVKGCASVCWRERESAVRSQVGGAHLQGGAAIELGLNPPLLSRTFLGSLPSQSRATGEWSFRVLACLLGHCRTAPRTWHFGPFLGSRSPSQETYYFSFSNTWTLYSELVSSSKIVSCAQWKRECRRVLVQSTNDKSAFAEKNQSDIATRWTQQAGTFP